MTNEEIKKIVSLINFYKVSTKSGEVYIGLIDGPYKGFEESKLEAYRKDYLYINLLNNMQIIRLYSEDIVSIELYKS
jgi:hypothetical protein